MLAGSFVLANGTAGHAAKGLAVSVKPSSFIVQSDGTSRFSQVKVRLENYGTKRSFGCEVKFSGGNVKTVTKDIYVNNLPHYYYQIKYVGTPQFTKRYSGSPYGAVYVFVNCWVA